MQTHFYFDFHEIHSWDVSRIDFYVPKVLFALKTALAISSNSASLLGFNKIKAHITEKTTKIPPLMSGDENWYFWNHSFSLNLLTTSLIVDDSHVLFLQAYLIWWHDLYPHHVI